MITRASFAALAALMLAFGVSIGGCDRGPTAIEEAAGPASVAESGEQPEVGDDLERLIEALFPEPGLRSAALVQARNIVRTVDAGEAEEAELQAMDLIDFALGHHEAGNLLPASPSTETVLALLIAEISEVAGLGTPIIGPAAFTDSGAIVHVDETGGEAITPDRTIGIVFPPGSLPDDTVIVITPIEETGEPADREGPLPTELDQYPLFAQISTIPEVRELGEPAVVGVCVVDPPDPYAPTPTVAARLRLAHPDPDDSSAIEILPLADASFLDCTSASTGSSGSLSPSGRGLSLSDPGRLGGSISSFSPFAAVDPQSGPRTITVLGNLGRLAGAAFAINDSDQVTGYGWTGCAKHPFLWENGVMTDLGTLGDGCEHTEAYDVNDAGQVVGAFDLNGEFFVFGPTGFLWESGTMTDLGLGWSAARGINDLGQVVGWTGSGGAFIWENGVTTHLGGDADFAEDINDNGQVVAGNAAGDRAFLWEDGILTDLGTLGGSYTYAAAINLSGQVVGESETASGEVHAFLWESGVMTDLGTLGGEYSFAAGINDLGQVVGESTTASGESRAFVWENGIMTELGTLDPTRRSIANDINESGLIVGFSANQPVMWSF